MSASALMRHLRSAAYLIERDASPQGQIAWTLVEGTHHPPYYDVVLSYTELPAEPRPEAHYYLAEAGVCMTCGLGPLGSRHSNVPESL